MGCLRVPNSRSGNRTEINRLEGFTSLGGVCESEIDCSETARPAEAARYFLLGEEDCSEKNYWRKDQASQTARRVGGAALHGDGGGAWVAGHEALGEMARYDFAVEYAGQFWRVQVKSTMFLDRGGYTVTVRDSHGGPYAGDPFDFVAAYV